MEQLRTAISQGPGSSSPAGSSRQGHPSSLPGWGSSSCAITARVAPWPRGPSLRVPQPRAHEGLAAVEEDRLDLHDERQDRTPLADRSSSKNGASLTSRARPLIRSVSSRPGMREPADVRLTRRCDTVDALVARSLGHCDCAVVDHVHQPTRRVALRAGVAGLSASAVASTQNGEAASQARSMAVRARAPWPRPAPPGSRPPLPAPPRS